MLVDLRKLVKEHEEHRNKIKNLEATVKELQDRLAPTSEKQEEYICDADQAKINAFVDKVNANKKWFEFKYNDQPKVLFVSEEYGHLIKKYCNSRGLAYEVCDMALYPTKVLNEDNVALSSC